MKIILSVSSIVATQATINPSSAQITVRGGDAEAVAYLKETKISKKVSMLMSGTTKKGTTISFVQRDTHAVWGVHQADATQFLALFSALAAKPGQYTVTLDDAKFEGCVATKVKEEVEF
jgi:hypothetical protein